MPLPSPGPGLTPRRPGPALTRWPHRIPRRARAGYAESSSSPCDHVRAHTGRVGLPWARGWPGKRKGRPGTMDPREHAGAGDTGDDGDVGDVERGRAPGPSALGGLINEYSRVA